MKEIANDHPIRSYFADAIHESLGSKIGLPESPEVERYLSELMTRFMHRDGIYAVKDAEGRPVTEVAEMVAEGDVRLKANSFNREREVHRHIGDFLLFWSGLFPEQLKYIKSPSGKDALLDPVGQGRLSYHVVSTFDHQPYAEESELFRQLSAGFEEYCFGLSLVRASFAGLKGQGWLNA